MLCDFSGSHGLKAMFRKRPSHLSALHPSPHTLLEHGFPTIVPSVCTYHPLPKPEDGRGRPGAARMEGGVAGDPEPCVNGQVTSYAVFLRQ